MAQNELNKLRQENATYINLLYENEENGILSSNEVQNKIRMKIKEIIEAHEKYHKITQGKDGRWRTRLPDGTPKGKQIAKTRREDLDRAIVKFYSEMQQEIKDTLEKLYPEWIAYKAVETSKNNAKRLSNTYTKYYAGSQIVKMELKKMNVPVLKKWLLDVVHANNLTRRQYDSMKTVLVQMLDYAVEYCIIDDNPAVRIRNISYQHFAVTEKKPVEKQVYLDDEPEKYMEECERMYTRYHNMTYLALAMNTVLGLRVGELAALKISSFDDNYVYVSAQEKVQFVETENGGYKRAGVAVSDHTKTEKSTRRVPLTATAKKYLFLALKAHNERNAESEYLFLDKKEDIRVTADALRASHVRVNKNIGTARKGTHSLRKTYASKLKASGELDDATVAKLMGHSSIKTTLNSYTFPVNSEEKTCERVQAVFEKSVTPCNTKILSFSNQKNSGKPA